MEGQATIDFVMNTVPEIQAPDGCFYTYRIYGPDEKPYKYYKARFPKGLWCEKGAELVGIIKAMNWELDIEVEEKNEEEEFISVPIHMRISGGMKDKKEDIKGGHFVVVIEVDERLTPTLVAMNGVLKLGHVDVEIYGGGIDKAIQFRKDMEEENRKEKEERRKEEEERNKEEEEITEEIQVGEITQEVDTGDVINDVDG